MKSEKPVLVWKSTKAGGAPVYGNRPLPLPHNGKPGAWHDSGGEPILCERGVHGCRTLRQMLVDGWLNEWLWVAEIKGGVIDGNNKSAGRYGRLLYRLETWNEQTARLFAADCAEAVVSMAQDRRSADAILAARRFAFGLISADELGAAWAAARDAARAAVRAAAWDAARDAARNAAWAAALDAALDAARDAQTLRLGQYLRGEVDLDAIRKSVE